MLDALRSTLLRILRVPSEPAPPPGDAATLRTFRAAPRYFHYRVARWVLQQAGTLAGLVFGYMFARSVLGRVGFTTDWIMWAEAAFIAGFVIQLPVSFAIMRLDFELRWYMLTDRSLRVREGIVSVKEKTMTFANVQNLEVRQNPLQRLFGISNVAVRAAGGGSKGSSGSSDGGGTHEARFEGVDNAEEIRRVIRERVRRHRDAGLGDPDEPADLAPVTALVRHAAAGGDDVLDAARAVLAEVRALRAARSAG
ncbi:MAG TPA: PH domain-containing protein [Longimicrobiales bacterium]|nr:PH domain-containing protein [Longimicrobiales bacterium]